jgi:hypothetical protein
MKKFLLLVITLSLIFSLSGCWLFGPAPEWTQVPEGHYRLEADFSNGVLPSNTEGIPYKESKFLDVPINSQYYDSETKSKVFTAEAYEASAMEIAEYLSEWTGLDFTLNSAKDVIDGGLVIDWSKQSTLVAGLDDREQKEDFKFDDAVSLNWFMMDTMKSTLASNLPVSSVYYCSDGQPLEFANPEDMAAQGLTELSADEPYYGSYYYVSKK